MIKINENSLFRKLYIKIYGRDPRESIKTNCGYYLSIIGIPLMLALKQITNVIVISLTLVMLIFALVQELLSEKRITNIFTELVTEVSTSLISKPDRMTSCFSAIIIVYCFYQYLTTIILLITLVIINAIIHSFCSSETITGEVTRVCQEIRKKTKLCTPIKFAYSD